MWQILRLIFAFLSVDAYVSRRGKSLHSTKFKSIGNPKQEFFNFQEGMEQLVRPVDIEFDKYGSVRLKTAVLHFRKIVPPSSQQSSSRGVGNEIDIDLYGMTHVAQPSYYAELQNLLESGCYDSVLFELITESSNTKAVSSKLPPLKSSDSSSMSVSQGITIGVGDTQLRQLQVPLYAEATEALASRLGLVSQMVLPYHLRDNWFIADLDSETVRQLETSRRDTNRARASAYRWAGRGADRRLSLKSFFLSDSSFTSILRLFCWLLPAPELGLLLFDWSRTLDARNGGFPKVLLPLLQNLASLNFADARRLAFTQQLLNGLPDAGGYGGGAGSDTEVRVVERNRECLRVLDAAIQRALTESTRTTDAIPAQPVRIAILYGVYHVAGLSAGLGSAGFRLSLQDRAASAAVPSLTAWTAGTPRSRLAAALMEPETHVKASSSPTKVPTVVESVEWLSSVGGGAIFLSGTIAYLGACALDWWVLLHLYSPSEAGISGSILLQNFFSALDVTVAKASAQGTGTLVTFSADPLKGAVLDAIFVAAYSSLYVQRHQVLLDFISQLGVSWDRSLFEEDGAVAS